RVREDPRLVRDPVAVRADDVRARARRGGPCHGGVLAGLLPPGSGSLPRGDSDEAVARHAQEPQVAEAPAALPRDSHQAVLRTRLHAARRAVRAPEGILSRAATHDDRIGEVFLDSEEIGARVREIGAEIAQQYA